MNCKNCNNALPDEAKFCGKCGVKNQNESSQIVNTVKNKTVRGTRIAFGFFFALIMLAVFFKVITFIAIIVIGLGLEATDTQIVDPDNIANLKNIIDILGFVGSAILANKVYKHVTRKNIDPNTPIKKKKWYQFGGIV